MIQNSQLNQYEKTWLEKMLTVDFALKEEIISQINRADIMRQNSDYYLSINFVGISLEKVSTEYTGAPLEMRAYLEGNIPIQFFLHVKRGVVSELEGFNADLSKINSNIDLNSAKVEILVDPKWK